MGICLEKDFLAARQRELDAEKSGRSGRARSSGRVMHKTKSAAEAQFIVQNTGAVTDVYVLKKKLGEGTFGTVFKGAHKVSKTQRAVKSLRKDALDPQKLRLEIELMMSLDHPHIIRLFETFEDKSTVYLIMDLCLGGELFQHIVNCGHFTEATASHVMSQLLSGVKYMHEMDVCHRDLKPENFLLTTPDSDFENNCLKIIDFGLSCHAAKKDVMNERVGTPLYISPQVLAGRYNRLCDTWSCGVIMYIVLSGKPPFNGKNTAEIFQNIRKSLLSFNGPTWETVSDDAKDLIKQLMRRLESKRLTASAAMDHVWIKQGAPKASGDELPSVMLFNLKNFHSVNKLKRAALRIIAGQLSNGQVLQLRKAFRLLDANGDGLLTVDELRQGMEQAGLGCGLELEDLVRAMDTDGNGMVSYSEFIAAALDRRRHLSQDVCRTAFEIFDVNGDGFITEAELSQMLADKSVQDSLGRRKVKQILAEVDKDGDGQIDFSEFMEMMGTGNDPQAGDSSSVDEGISHQTSEGASSSTDDQVC